MVAPPGLWRFAGNLTVPVGCALSGSYATVPGDPICTSHNVGVAGGCLPAAGTVLMPTGGRGTSCDVPLASPNGGIPCEEVSDFWARFLPFFFCLPALSWMCVGTHRHRVLSSPICA